MKKALIAMLFASMMVYPSLAQTTSQINAQMKSKETQRLLVDHLVSKFLCVYKNGPKSSCRKYERLSKKLESRNICRNSKQTLVPCDGDFVVWNFNESQFKYFYAYSADKCQGGSGDNPETLGYCSTRDDIFAKILAGKFNTCMKGPKEDSPTYLYKWRKCK